MQLIRELLSLVAYIITIAMFSSLDCFLEPYFKKFASDINFRSTHFDAKENFRLRVENMYMPIISVPFSFLPPPSANFIHWHT